MTVFEVIFTASAAFYVEGCWLVLLLLRIFSCFFNLINLAWCLNTCEEILLLLSTFLNSNIRTILHRV